MNDTRPCSPSEFKPRFFSIIVNSAYHHCLSVPMADAEVLETVSIVDGELTKDVLVRGDVDSGHPAAGDEVTAHYTGRLLDGTVFDSSVRRGTPFKVRLSIPGPAK